MKTKDSNSSKPNILDTIKLSKALRLAKQKSKDGQLEEAKNIYEDILQKFSKNKTAYIFLVFATLFWSGNFIVGKAASMFQIPPFSLNFYRWFFAWLILAPFTLKEILKNDKKFIKAVAKDDDIILETILKELR